MSDYSQSSTSQYPPESFAARRARKFGNPVGTPRPKKEQLPYQESSYGEDDQSQNQDERGSGYSASLSGRDNNSLPQETSMRPPSAASVVSHQSGTSSSHGHPREQGNRASSSLRYSSTPTPSASMSESYYAESVSPQHQQMGSPRPRYAGSDTGSIHSQQQPMSPIERLHDVLGTSDSQRPPPTENARSPVVYPPIGHHNATPHPGTYHASDPTRSGRVAAADSSSSSMRVASGRDQARATSGLRETSSLAQSSTGNPRKR